MSYLNDQLYEVQLVNLKMNTKTPINVGIFLKQLANLRMLELHYNPFDM